MYLYFFIFLMADMAAGGGSQSLRFVQEEIRFCLNGDTVQVEGIYKFYNPASSSVRTTLSYPFPKTLPFPDSLIAIQMDRQDTLSVIRKDHAVLFSLQVPEKQSARLFVRYLQPVPGRSFTYLLTTTGFWQRPLETASYTLIIPHTVRLTSLTPDYDRVCEKEGNWIYVIEKSGFIPENDFNFTWEVVQ
ncbi:hypothetical protein GF406_05530 [candidate division KSB1 bacterium]|nr:hypothetical protein [candidate division KSB1 bacterium]